jgi:hypothetical protein
MKKIIKKIKAILFTNHHLTKAQQWSMFKESKDYIY